MVASLVGDPARANMLTALMTGKALTATELAHQAGITPQTASSHLSKLEGGGLIELAGWAAPACCEACREADKLWCAHPDSTTVTTNRTAQPTAMTS